MKHLAGLYLCHLSDRKFGNNFQDLINPICRSGHDIEITTHWAHYISNALCIVKKKILIGIFEFFIISFLLLEKKGFNACINKCTVMCIIEYTLSTQRSTDSLKGIFDDNLLFLLFHC